MPRSVFCLSLQSFNYHNFIVSSDALFLLILIKTVLHIPCLFFHGDFRIISSNLARKTLLKMRLELTKSVHLWKDPMCNDGRQPFWYSGIHGWGFRGRTPGTVLSLLWRLDHGGWELDSSEGSSTPTPGVEAACHPEHPPVVSPCGCWFPENQEDVVSPFRIWP